MAGILAEMGALRIERMEDGSVVIDGLGDRGPKRNGITFAEYARTRFPGSEVKELPNNRAKVSSCNSTIVEAVEDFLNDMGEGLSFPYQPRPRPMTSGRELH